MEGLAFAFAAGVAGLFSSAIAAGAVMVWALDKERRRNGRKDPAISAAIIFGVIAAACFAAGAFVLA